MSRIFKLIFCLLADISLISAGMSKDNYSAFIELIVISILMLSMAVVFGDSCNWNDSDN